MTAKSVLAIDLGAESGHWAAQGWCESADEYDEAIYRLFALERGVVIV